MKKQKHEKIKKMPKLGWKDHILYISALFIVFGLGNGTLFLQTLLTDSIAFSTPDVIAVRGKCGAFAVPLMLFLIFAGILIVLPFYTLRYPIFGRKDISYGAPKYPSIYPLLMKNKPQLYVPQKEKQRENRFRKRFAIITAAIFLICIALYPFSICGRSVMLQDGSIEIFSVLNNKTRTYQTEDIQTVVLDFDYINHSHRIFNGKWYPELTIHTSDHEEFHFTANQLNGSISQSLQTMLDMKALYGELIQIKGTEHLWKSADDLDLSDEDIVLLCRIYELHQ